MAIGIFMTMTHRIGRIYNVIVYIVQSFYKDNCIGRPALYLFDQSDGNT